jgi:methyl-accepting chemotaxis protein
MRFDFPTHRSGDTWRGVNSITILDGQTPINLTGCKIYIQFRSIYNYASPVVLTLSTEDNTIKISNVLTGIITIPEQIIDIPVGRYRYDLQIDFPNGSSMTYMEGEFEIKPGITTPTFDSSINTRFNALRINSLISLISSNSAIWGYQGTDIKNLTGVWQDVSTLVQRSSSSWAVDSLIRVLSSYWQNSYNLMFVNSGYWTDVSTLVSNNSSLWFFNTDVKSLSSNWQTNYTISQNFSGAWNSVYSSVGNLSANWDSVYTSVKDTSANWDSVYTSVKDTSANWDSVYTTYNENSATYASIEFANNKFLPLSGGTITGDLSVLSSLQVGFGDTVLFVSGNKVGIKTETPNVELTVNGSISSNDLIYDSAGNSSEWNSAYTTYNENSATYATITYVDNKFLPLSGGSITGNLIVDGDFKVYGEVTQLDTIISTTSSLNITNEGTDVALKVTQNGFSDIAEFYDDTNIALVIKNGGNIGINTDNPNQKLTVNGSISSNELIYDGFGNSSEWNSAYTSVKDTSANWDSVYTSVKDTSANWDSVYTSVKDTSANWDSVYTSVKDTSANWDSVYTSVKDTSANWDSVYTSVLNTSANWDSVYTSVKDTSANWDSVYTSVKDTSANWDSVYTSVKDTSANWDSVYTSVKDTSANWDSVYTSVLNTSANWDSVYTSVKDTSANWDSVYTSVKDTSANWDSVYTSVKDTSANWDSVYTSVKDTSANWDSVYTSVLNTSANWDSVYTSVKDTSANWDSVYTSVKDTSANWDSVYSSVVATSANWDSVYTSVKDTSANWDSVYTSVKDTSANWDSVYTSVKDTSANWDSVYTSSSQTSANWDSVYTSVKDTSANWDSVYTSVKDTSANWDSVYTSSSQTSANWDSVYTTYNENSATYATIEFANNKFLPLSGGTITGDLSVLSSLDIGLSLEVGFGDTVLFVSGDKIGVNTETPNLELTVNGSISSNNLIYDSVGNSSEWNQSYSNVISTSSILESVYATVLQNSSVNWSRDAEYAELKALSSTWIDTRTTVLTNSSSWLSDFSITQEFFDDFLTLGAASTLPNAFLKPANKGGAIFVNAEDSKQGVLILSTNPLLSANQRSGVTSNSTINFGCGTEYRLIFSARRGINTFDDINVLGRIDMGFHNQVSTDSDEPSYGCYFTSENGGNWKAVTKNQINHPLLTETTTPIPCDETWRTFEVKVAQDSSIAQYYIDNILVATHTTSIPNGTNTQSAIGYRCFRKTKAALNVELRIDWQSLIMKRNNQLWK